MKKRDRLSLEERKEKGGWSNKSVQTIVVKQLKASLMYTRFSRGGGRTEMTSPDRETDSRAPLEGSLYPWGRGTPAASEFFNRGSKGAEVPLSQTCILPPLPAIFLPAIYVLGAGAGRPRGREGVGGGDGRFNFAFLVGSGTNRLCFFVSRFVRKTGRERKFVQAGISKVSSEWVARLVDRTIWL